MKHLLRLFLVAVTTAGVMHAQSFSGPESVEFDPNDGNYFVGNANNGTMVKMTPGGTLSNFATGITFPTGPHGLELVGDTLYACDGANLKMIDRVTGTLIANISMGATFLNGITHKDNNLYITDFSAKKIHRFNMLTRQHNIFCSSLSTKTPNGIIYDDINDRLVYCCWGTNAPVHAISLVDSTVTQIATTTLGNCDGITMNCSGNFYISSWSPNRVTKFSPTFTSPSTFLSTGISSPADIYFNRMNDSLFVPNSGNNTVSMKNDVSCTISIDEKFNNVNLPVLMPNPAGNFIEFGYVNAGSEYKIYNAMGALQMLGKCGKHGDKINIERLEKGLYFVMLINGSDNSILKLIKE